MKAVAKLFLTLFIAIFCICCEPIENENNYDQNNKEETNKESEDFYYVRFEAESDYNYIYSVSISLTGCENFKLNVSGKSFSETIGPANKGAVATMVVSMVSGECQRTAIYVSKNNGPFALNKQGN